MASKDVYSHTTEDSLFGKGKETRTAEQIVKEKVEGPNTPSTCTPSKETIDEWRKAEAATVKAEEEARRAAQLACAADDRAAQAAAAKGLSEDALRKKAEVEDRVESLEEAERRRRMEAADLERMLEEARELMKRAQRRRVEILEESKRIASPATDLLAEADRLEREANAAHDRVESLQKRIDALRASKPHKIAMEKEDEAARLHAEVEELMREVAIEEANARRKQEVAERELENARAKVKEADELAKRYWAVRDESKRLESYAKRLAGEAADDARDAIKKRNEMEKLQKKADKAENDALAARQRKAELEKQAQELAAEAAAQAARVAQLQREAEARRDQAGTFEMQAERKKTEAQTVVVPAVDEAELRRKAEEARKAAESAAARRAAAESELTRLEELHRAAVAEARTKAAEFDRTRREAQAARAREAEAWDQAKEHGEKARSQSAEEVARKLDQVDASQLQPTEHTTEHYHRQHHHEHREVDIPRERPHVPTKTITETRQVHEKSSYSSDTGSKTEASYDYKRQEGDDGPTGHTKESEYAKRTHLEGKSDAEILRSEGADLPHTTRAGRVELPGADA
ncbi:hypothetical protein N2152v2_010751 [Parachlorella kessleri]